ncbi:MAG: hypothetical protein F4X45_09980 [Chloroflexi bacterium]|nr:hypothetical protein [Chloroflexota bacterium]
MQVCTKSFFDTANSRKVSTGEIRPTVPNRSQKEDVLTSSNYSRSWLKSGLAFPIMLAAVGLLLASLVLGLGTNLARALGPQNDAGTAGAGICDYSDLMREAILANNGHQSYNCNNVGYTSETAADQDPWGGVKSATDDAPNDLDLSGKGISTFAPGKGELDGFNRGARVDLRGNGLTVADLNVKDALGTFDDDTRTYANFGDSTEGTENDQADDATPAANAAAAVGLTFLLDGGSTTANGLALAEYEGTEGEILWVTFEYGSPHKDFSYPDDRDKSVWMRVDVHVGHDDQNGATAGGKSSAVSILVNSGDPEGTLYAVPFMLPEDSDIEKTESEDIDIRFVHAGTFAEAVAGTGATITGFTGDRAFVQADFDGSLTRNADDADLSILDEDTPAVPVGDRQDVIEDYITDFFGISAKRVGVDHLAGKVAGAAGGAAYNDGNLLILPVGAAPPATGVDANGVPNDGAPAPDDPISSISVGDLAGLTGLTKLDLSKNEISELPSGLFSEVGTGGKGDLSTEINLLGDKMGPTGEGFTLDNLGPVGDELVAGQYLVVTAPYKDKRVGFLQSSYEATEGGAWVFDVNITGDDATANAAIQILKIGSDNGDLAKDVNGEYVDLRRLAAGNYRIAIGIPENKDDDDGGTLSAAFGYVDNATLTEDLNDDGTTVNMTTILDIVPLTIRDVSYDAPAPAPVMPESSFESVVVTQNEFVEAPGNEDLKHNISNLTVTIGGNAVSANFLDVYNGTGGLERWGYPTSEVVEIPGIGLTQFFQRGALHLESNETVTRLLAWDYVGGGLGGSDDQGVEDAPDAGPEGGEQIGAFGHYVANVDADGNATGFLDFFNRLGGVAAFGFPKTEARADSGADGTLMEPGTTAGFTRQYFQAAVFQLAEDGSVQLTLLGDTLRGILVPGYADIDAFGAADALSVGDEVSPPVIDS